MNKPKHLLNFIRPLVHLALLCGATILTGNALQDSTERRFTPRELFYSAEPAPQKNAEKKKSTAGKGKAGASNTGKSQDSTSQGRSAPDAEGRITVATAPAPANGPALGLKYEIWKSVGENLVAVTEKTVFRTGDAIELRILTNSAGYLYLVNRGSSGGWTPMFPSSEIAGGNNYADPWRTYVLPPRRMRFVEPKGIEHFTIVFSREAIDDLDKLIYSLQQANPLNAAKQLVAGTTIENGIVERLRNLHSRDLIIEPASEKDTAVYVVNPTGSPDSRLITSFQLVHQ